MRDLLSDYISGVAFCIAKVFAAVGSWLEGVDVFDVVSRFAVVDDFVTC